MWNLLSCTLTCMMWCHVTCDVMWPSVLSCDLLWCHVTFCDVMWLSVLSCDLLCCHVTFCGVPLCSMWMPRALGLGGSPIFYLLETQVQRGHMQTLIRSLLHILERFHHMYSVNLLCVIFSVSYWVLSVPHLTWKSWRHVLVVAQCGNGY